MAWVLDETCGGGSVLLRPSTLEGLRLRFSSCFSFAFPHAPARARSRARPPDRKGCILPRVSARGLRI
eukprot:scaffold50686_cov67-Phaeocystis_antarctica.AAC.2